MQEKKTIKLDKLNIIIIKTPLTYSQLYLKTYKTYKNEI